MLKKVIGYTKRKRFMKSKFIENSSYFCPGEYFFDDSLRFIYLKDSKSYETSKELFGEPIMSVGKKIFVYVVKKLFFDKGILINPNESVSEFKGTAYFIGTDKTDSGKAFDFVNNKVITFYFSEKEFDVNLNNNYYFKQYFNSPRIIMYDKFKLLIMEELISYKAYTHLSAEERDTVMISIFKHYIDYFKVCQSQGRVILKRPSSMLAELETQEELRNLLEETNQKHILEEDFPFLQMHGDLWAPNILLNKKDNEELYFIDFEYSGEYLFLYDIFWFIQDQVVNYNNNNFLEKYLIGAYDSYLKLMFGIFGLSFREGCRRDYLRIYFINVYINRWRKLDKKDREIQVNRFRSIISSSHRNDETLKQYS